MRGGIYPSRRKASLVKGRWTPKAAGGILTGLALRAVTPQPARGIPPPRLRSAPPFDKGGLSTIRRLTTSEWRSVPQTPKPSPQQKLIIVEKILAGETSRQAAAKSVGVSVAGGAAPDGCASDEAEGPERSGPAHDVPPPDRRGKTVPPSPPTWRGKARCLISAKNTASAVPKTCKKWSRP